MKKFGSWALLVLAVVLIGCGGEEAPEDLGTMVTVTAGSFWMGCDEAVINDCDSNAIPYHKVTLSEYQIDKYEVTASEYQECIDAGSCNNDNTSKQHFSPIEDIRDNKKCNLGKSDRKYHPMNCLTWYGAKAYCKWKGKRLPTEAEWEKAARGTDERVYPWGNETATCDYAVMYVNGVNGCGKDRTFIVGSKPKGVSPYGIMDMAGNVSEFVSDYYDVDYYSNSPEENPKGPDSGNNIVYRGGSCNTGEEYTRSFPRIYIAPFGTFNDLGFRCAKSVTPGD